MWLDQTSPSRYNPHLIFVTLESTRHPKDLIARQYQSIIWHALNSTTTHCWTRSTILMPSTCAFAIFPSSLHRAFQHQTTPTFLAKYDHEMTEREQLTNCLHPSIGPWSITSLNGGTCVETLVMKHLITSFMMTGSVIHDGCVDNGHRHDNGLSWEMVISVETQGFKSPRSSAIIGDRVVATSGNYAYDFAGQCPRWCLVISPLQSAFIYALCSWTTVFFNT